eukprot:gene28246-37264_t
MAGRKRKEISLSAVTDLRRLGLSWNEIGAHPDVNVSRNKLLTWRKDPDVNFIEPNDLIDNEQLDHLVEKETVGQPRRGEISIGAHLFSTGFKVPRQQLRESIHRVDPDGVIERSRKPIKRKIYVSDGPHHCWHIDGNHKLIRWGIVIHGCVDGCTRTIISLVARDNNLSHVALAAFEDGVARYQLPMKVRADYGGENVKIAQYMIEHRGTIEAFKTGPSTSNTRIERLWRDMRNHTIQAYIDLFYSFENDGMDLSNLLDIYTLQYLFLPRINEDLQQFMSMWNNHKLSSENSRTPLQLLLHYHANSTAALPEQQPGEYDYFGEHGIADEGEHADGGDALPVDEDDGLVLSSVSCEPIECPLNGEQLIEFQSRVVPLTMNIDFNQLGL